VTSEIYTTDILDKEHFWTEELMKVNQDFLFGCSTGVWGRGKCSVAAKSGSPAIVFAQVAWDSLMLRVMKPRLFPWPETGKGA
jgi:hypothetical protein